MGKDSFSIVCSRLFSGEACLFPGEMSGNQMIRLKNPSLPISQERSRKRTLNRIQPSREANGFECYLRSREREAAIAVEEDSGDTDFVNGVGGPAVEGVGDDAVREEVGKGIAEGGGVGERRC
ncbi:hypothetical protein Acr_16g0007380 [Actinidia rufa]|uniref:Uncharacterized protein n=1 Tax=Actinidia rufa TaxID=165716 RepID=A0A7J0FZX6_9ERIC|nr:hypothetical protein Acr_16g0007380 [Actinidia rufa]